MSIMDSCNISNIRKVQKFQLRRPIQIYRIGLKGIGRFLLGILTMLNFVYFYNKHKKNPWRERLLEDDNEVQIPFADRQVTLSTKPSVVENTLIGYVRIHLPSCSLLTTSSFLVTSTRQVEQTINISFQDHTMALPCVVLERGDGLSLRSGDLRRKDYRNACRFPSANIDRKFGNL